MVLALSLSLSAHGLTALALAVKSGRAIPELPSAPPEGARNLLGDSFELPAPDPEPQEPPAPAEAPAPQAAAPAAAPGAKTQPADGYRRPAAPAGAPSAATGAGAGGTSPAPVEGAGASLYGAAGDRSAVDLATAITRGFPQAASADPVWASAPMGDAGAVDLLLTLDESGKLVDSQVGPGAPAPLAAGIRRTLALVGGRAFTSRGKVTRLHLVATISPDTVHDGLHGDVFAIGGSYVGGEGQAFFALAIGRRVDLKVRPR